MNKKGIAWATLIMIIIILVSFVIIFGWQFFFGKFVKEESESSICKSSVIISASKIGTALSPVLPKLNCPKIPVKIESKNEEGIKKELLDLLVRASGDFGVVRKTYSKITGTYCRRRYHPITFKKKDLIIKDFSSYRNKNIPDNFVGDFIFPVKEINTNREYSILFIVIYRDNWETYLANIAWKPLTLGSFQYKYESQYIGFALMESMDVLYLKCDHLV